MAVSLDFFHFQQIRLEMTSSSLVEITETAISTCPPFFTPNLAYAKTPHDGRTMRGRQPRDEQARGR
jgi:hypothetical protein